MVYSITDRSALWKFSCPGAGGPVELPATVTTQPNQPEKVVFKIPRAYGNDLTIELPTQAKENEYQGRYDQGDGIDDITFKVLDNGKRLEGFPQGYADRLKWSLVRNDETPGPSDNEGSQSPSEGGCIIL